MEIINVYTFYSNYIAQQLLTTGKYILNNTKIKKLKSIRKDIIKLIHTYLQSTENPEYTKNYVNPLMNILEDFRTNPEDTKYIKLKFLLNIKLENQMFYYYLVL